MTLTLQQCRDKVARTEGYENWKQLRNNTSDLNSGFFELIVSKVAILFAAEKIKEALQLAAERAEIEYTPSRYPYRPDVATIDKSSVLSLEEELIKNIKKEI